MGAVIPAVRGRCPMGCGHTLTLGAGGHVTCSLAVCPNPSAADEILSVGGDVEMLLAGLGVASVSDLKRVVDLYREAAVEVDAALKSAGVEPDPRWVPGWPEVTGS